MASKYKLASKKTPPAVTLNISVPTEGMSGNLQNVIVFGGPGSWKKSAYWDEYIVALANPSAA